MEMRTKPHGTESRAGAVAAGKPEPGCSRGILGGWVRCPSSDSCQLPRMMGTQQVQRRGLGTEREYERTAWSWAPLPGPRPSAKQPCLRSSEAPPPPQALGPRSQASLDETEGSPSMPGRKDRTRKVSIPRTGCARWSPHPQKPQLETNIRRDKIYVPGQIG